MIIVRLCLFFFSFFFAYYLEAEQLKLNVSARSAILINADSGAILYEKNAHAPSFPASITKVATALYALEKKEHALDELVIAFQDCLSMVPAHLKRVKDSTHPPYRLEPDGTSIGLQVGEQMPLKSLLYGMMLSSGNDAANVIAHFVSGSVDNFMEELNEYFQQKGFKETHFNNPHGLHHPEHYTTAYDMAMITKEAMKKHLFRQIVKTIQYARPETNKQQASVFLQSNRLLRRGPFFYPKAIGVKTGYHSMAGHTLIAAAEQDDRILIAVVLACPDVKQRFKDVTHLFEAAFAEKKLVRTLFSRQYDPFSLQVKGAKGPLIASLTEDLKCEYFPSEEPELKAFLHWKELKLPIAQGEMVGEIQLMTNKGVILKTAPLYAASSVEMTALFKIAQVCRNVCLKLFNPSLIMGLIGLVIIGIGITRFRRVGMGRSAGKKK